MVCKLENCTLLAVACTHLETLYFSCHDRLMFAAEPDASLRAFPCDNFLSHEKHFGVFFPPRYKPPIRSLALLWLFCLYIFSPYSVAWLVFWVPLFLIALNVPAKRWYHCWTLPQEDGSSLGSDKIIILSPFSWPPVQYKKVAGLNLGMEEAVNSY